MIERPVLFGAPMVRATIDGLKTKTRRVIIPQPPEDWIPRVGMYSPTKVDRDGEEYPGEEVFGASDEVFGVRCPYGPPGTVLWMRETWSPWADRWTQTVCAHNEGKRQACLYRADFSGRCGARAVGGDTRWHPSIHMPRAMSRIDLLVKDIRVERVQDITEEDAKEEGIQPLFSQAQIHEPRYRAELDLQPMPWRNYLWHGNFNQGEGNARSDAWAYQYSSYESARGSFSSLWELLNGPRGYGWSVNPFVWVISFER